MFSKDEVEGIIAELTRKYKKATNDHEPHNPLDADQEWERILRDAYTGMARVDAGVALGDIDPRVIEVIQEFQQKAPQKA